MKCVIRKHGTLIEGHTTLTLERGRAVLVFKNPPAQVCASCGEAYLDETVSRNLLAAAGRAVAAGGEVDARHYVAA